MRLASRAVGLAGAAALGLSLFTACGSDSSSSEDTAAPAAKADDALASKVPEAIKKDGKILVGSDASYAPSEFIDADGKTIKGFDVDLFKAVAQKLGLEANFQNAKFDSIINGVKSGKYEIGVSSFTVNADRMKQVNMVSYYSAGTQWFAAKGNPQKVDPENACGMKVAVQTGTVQESEDLPVRQKACKAAGKPAIKVDSYQGQDQATSSVVSGKDDAGLADSPVGAYAVKQAAGKLELVGDIYDAAPYGYAVPIDQKDLADAVSEAVNALIEDGTYEKVLKKWGVEQGAATTSEVNPSVG